MASIYMRIDGTTPKGAATVEKIGGKDGFFAIDTVNWSAVRALASTSVTRTMQTKAWSR